MIVHSGIVSLRHKVMAAGLLVMVLGLPISTLVGMLAAECNDRIELMHSRALEIARERTLIDAAPDLRRRTAALRRELAASHSYYTDPTTEEASASLAAGLKSIIEINHAQVRSLTIRPGTQLDHVDRLSVELDLAMRDSQLGNFIHAMQAYHPYIFVRHLTISPAPIYGAENQLLIHLDVTALRR